MEFVITNAGYRDYRCFCKSSNRMDHLWVTFWTSNR